MSQIFIESIDVIVTMDDQSRELHHQHILLEGPTIKAIGPDLVRPPTAKTIDGRGKVALPGFVNTHHHMFQLLNRGLPRTENAIDLSDWLVVNFALFQEVDPELVYYASLLGLGLLMKSGCTLVSDNHYPFPAHADKKLIDASIRAARDLGVRFHPTRGACSDPGPGYVPESLIESEEEILQDCERLVNAYHDPSPFSMVRIALSPMYFMTSTRNLMLETVRYARQKGLHCHTHLAEGGEYESNWSLEHYGLRPFEVMESLGWVGPDVWFAHCLYLSDDEMRRMGDYRCGLAHNSVCNARGVRRVAPIFRMLEHGVRVGLGVDGDGGYGNMIAEIQTAMVLHRLTSGGADLERKLLRIATRGGAEVLGWDSLGSLEPGKAADVVLIDTCDLHYAGAMHDVVASIVLFGANQTIHTSICNGEVIVEKGRLTKYDEDEIRDRANQVSREYVKRASKRTGIDFYRLPEGEEQWAV